MTHIGEQAPDLKLPSHTGAEFDLQNQTGPCVIFFYPKADTPGCTTEAKDFTQLSNEFAALDVAVVGISPDKVGKLEKFTDKHDLSVTLLSDEDLLACNAFGVWVEKSMYGKTYMGVERSTFLIDENGVILEEWRKVRVKEHALKVLDAARSHLAG